MSLHEISTSVLLYHKGVSLCQLVCDVAVVMVLLFDDELLEYLFPSSCVIYRYVISIFAE